MDGFTHVSAMDMPFARYFDAVDYKCKLTKVISGLREDGFILTGPYLSLWRGSEHHSDR